MASTLPASLSSLSTSIEHLNTSLQHLDSCTADLPRLSNVLNLTSHFALLPASKLSAAQQNLVAEIEPEIEALLAKVEQIVERREGRGEWLRARWGLYEGRLGRDGSSAAASADFAQAEQEELKREKKFEDKIKAQRLRQKKERLSYAVERLTLQAQQRERQLRMSVAAHAGGDEGADDADEGDSGF